MPITKLQDTEFGAIAIRRTHLSRSVRLKIDQRGIISISMPRRAPLFLAKNLLEEAREQIRRNMTKVTATQTVLQHGDIIGKSHRLFITAGDRLSSSVSGTLLRVTLPLKVEPTSAEAQTFIKQAALKALRTQAKAFLTRRLRILADEHGFNYDTVRFSNAGTRWGSCSSRGTISLNIWLMQLPFDLIDYVLVHELCHTRQMNHSPQFWALVEGILPDYRERRRAIKAQHPYM